MRIAGFQKSSFIDYKDKICAIIFTQGCNFKCGYCHNPELNNCTEKKEFKENDILNFLKTRQNKLDAVVITGGEPTLQKDLKAFTEKIKEMDFLIKLDTNGSNPMLLKELVKEDLINYVAMDIKGPLEKYAMIANSNVNIEKIKESIDFIINSNVDYEFRTTVVKSQLVSEDFEKISELIKGAQNYYLQKFIPTKLLDQTFNTAQTYSDEEFNRIIKILSKNIKNIELR